MTATTALREALNQGISSGIFIDTKIILYSHKAPCGKVSRPKVLYASSHVLKTVPHFNDLLFGNFAESQPKYFREAIDEEETAADYGYLSDSDLEDDEDERPAPLKHTSESKVIKPEDFNLISVVLGTGRSGCEEQEEWIEKGKVVKIPDIAVATFQAFLMYLYTGSIEFAPFGSEENRRSRRADIVDPSDEKVPQSSPKSIYRLADKYDVPGLKNLALNQIRGELAKCDIVEESFSRFASQYDEVRNLYVERLASAWMEDSTTEATRTSVKKKVRSFVEGYLDHAKEVLSALWEIASKDEDITAPASRAPSTAPQPASHVLPASMRRALIRSVRKGAFFDRKYWARYSKAVDALKPVHFSSTIMDDRAQELNELIKYVGRLNDSASDLEEDICIESDFEGDFSGVKNKLPKAVGTGETRAVLIRGSFSAWKSLFFYHCTGEISFAPLTSQGADNRSNYIRTNTVETMPPPCSPKSIYVLANLLGIRPLCEKALANIQSKVDSDNIVSEVFSQVTAGHMELMELQSDLLLSNFKNPKTIADVKENIRRIPDDTLSHCAGPLNLVFKKAFELKKKKKQPAGVKLRCPNYYCSWKTEHVSYLVLGSSVFCTRCGGGYYMQCANCGYNRAGNFLSCHGCGKRFM